MKYLKILILFILLLFIFDLKASNPSLVSYQSVYEIKLLENEVKSRFGQPSLKDANGELLIDWFNNCDSWVSNQRMLISFLDKSGVGTVSDISYSLVEDVKSEKMKFVLQVKENNMVVQRVRGEAIKDEEVEVKILMPKSKNIKFSKDVLFPHEHLKIILNSLGNEDMSIFSKQVYEGTLPDSFFNISTFINKKSFKLEDIELPKDVVNKFWDVRMAYYEGKSQTPSLELTAKMNQQGIVSYFKYDYPDYSLKMKLKKLVLMKDNCR